jgi:glycosyltransferase involved in cell wall biosynthesis
LIIDDGSTDGTGILVKGWIAEGRITIRYIYQENQGMHGAHNTAYRNIFTELNTCIDSDDFMPLDAVDKIVSYWKGNGSKRYAGLVGLDIANGKGMIGSSFPAGMKETTLSGYYSGGGMGDKKLVYRTDVIQAYPEYPVFKGEKYFSLGYKYLLIDQDYSLLTLNEPLVIVDYQDDGSSFNMYRQYWNNPNGFMFLRKEHMRLYPSIKKRFKSCIHYVSHCLRARRSEDLFDNPCPILTVFAIVPGICLYLRTRYMVRNGRKMIIN